MRQAIDKISNRIQNILLQEMEDFEGIFIATTNLASNLDPAFERRLLYKIEFKQPGEEVRKKIWKTMIPELEDVYIDILASKYNFSGGQIENVATKRDLDYIIEGTEPSILKIQEYCETEMIKSKNPMNKIGFRTEENYNVI
jgi:SpoVK/Ycf46/Vps4 family AAA+-type ATPase